MKFYIIDESSELSSKEKDILVECYRNYFAKLDGIDELDAFLKVIETSSDKVSDELINVSNTNYKKAKSLVESLFNTRKDNLLLIYNNNKFIGGGRLIKEDSKIIKVLEILFYDLDLNDQREIWVKILDYLENYYKAKDFEKIYLEIPFYEGPLLYRAKDLGYVENTDDIIISGDSKTYILNKDLGRVENVK